MSVRDLTWIMNWIVVDLMALLFAGFVAVWLTHLFDVYFYFRFWFIEIAIGEGNTSAIIGRRSTKTSG